jgi:hypothetical protein
MLPIAEGRHLVVVLRDAGQLTPPDAVLPAKGAIRIAPCAQTKRSQQCEITLPYFSIRTFVTERRTACLLSLDYPDTVVAPPNGNPCARNRNGSASAPSGDDCNGTRVRSSPFLQNAGDGNPVEGGCVACDLSSSGFTPAVCTALYMFQDTPLTIRLQSVCAAFHVLISLKLPSTDLYVVKTTLAHGFESHSLRQHP